MYSKKDFKMLATNINEQTLASRKMPGPLELGLDPRLPSEACKVNVSVMKRERQRGHPETEKVGEVESCL